MLFDRIEKYISESEIDAALNGAGCVLCAYSGGADSGVLLTFLDTYLKKRGIKLAAAHVNHMIRGSEADSDEEFCRERAAALNIPFYAARLNIPEAAKLSGKGLEECARDERYSFLLDTAASLGDNTLIACAHSATDNLETVLFNLIRGTGTRGLAGIAPVRGSIIRPLLCCTSEEIRQTAEEMNIAYVYDCTNSNNDYTRNFIRNNLVPLARKVNPSADSAALRLAGIAREDNEYLYLEAEKLLSGNCNFTYVKRQVFEAAHPAIAARIMFILYRSVQGSEKNLSHINLSDAISFAKTKTGTLSMPDGITLFSDTYRIYFAANDKIDCADMQVTLPLDGSVVPFGKFFAVSATTGPEMPVFDQNIYNLFIHKTASFDRIYGSLFVRTRIEGDKIFVAGIHKKLKKLMCDEKVPRRMRSCMPVFCDENGIFWVPTLSMRDGCAGKTLNMYVFTRKGSVFDE